MGSVYPPLSKADLLTRMYALAAFYSDAAERKREAAKNDTLDLKALLLDLKIRLEESFSLTAEQKVRHHCGKSTSISLPP